MNANDVCFEDFRLGDKRLSDFGGIIYNEDGWKISNGLSSNKTTTKMTNRDGEIFLGLTYNPRVITIPIFIQEDIDIDEFYAWLLNGEQELEFEDSERKINVVLDTQIDITSYYNGDYKGLSTLSFIAYDPYWKAVRNTYSVMESPTSGQSVKVKTKSNVTTYPIIQITPSTANVVKFRINTTTVTLNINSSEIGQEIVIDCEKEEVYCIKGGVKYNLFNIYSSDDFYSFPTLDPYRMNTVQLVSGKVNNISVCHNDRWI